MKILKHEFEALKAWADECDREEGRADHGPAFGLAMKAARAIRDRDEADRLGHARKLHPEEGIVMRVSDRDFAEKLVDAVGESLGVDTAVMAVSQFNEAVTVAMEALCEQAEVRSAGDVGRQTLGLAAELVERIEANDRELQWSASDAIENVIAPFIRDLIAPASSLIEESNKAVHRASTERDAKLGINEMVTKAHAQSKKSGWWDEYLVQFRADGDWRENSVDPDDLITAPDTIAAKLMLIVSEVSEALEALRDGNVYTYEENGKPEGMAAELADVLIRIGDLCGALGIDLEAAVKAKMAYNATRPHRHGGKAL